MVEVYLKLFAISLISVAVSVGVYFLDKKTAFNKLPYTAKQAIIGVIFGIVAITGTELGVDVGGATANVRDAAPLCAGLIFGGPAGIIAGAIGGVERWFAVYWGAGAYAQIACSVSTVLAGLYAAALRKFLFEGKRPSATFGFVTGVIMEVVHLTILFITHIGDPEKAIDIVSICVIPMTVFNGLAVMLSVLTLNIISGSLKANKHQYRKISQQIQMWLLSIIVVGFVTSSAFVYAFQTGASKNDAKLTLQTQVQDVKNDIEEQFKKVDTSDPASVAEFTEEITEITRNRHVGRSGFIVVIDKDGTILSDIASHNDEYLGKNISVLGLECFSDYKENMSFEAKVLQSLSFAMHTSTEGYTVIASISEAEVFNSRQSLLILTSFMEALIFGMLFFTIYNLIKQLVVKKINSVNKSLAKIIDGDLNVSVNVRSSDEFASLSKDINSTVTTLKHYIDEAAKRLDKELAFAKSVQHSVLPSVFPPFPNISDFDIYAEMHTAKEVGGDFYDFYMCGESKVAFCVADVSGKGIPAAMFMMTTKTMIKNLTETGLSPEEVFNLANEKLCEGNDANMFVTAWLGILDYKTGVVEFVNAGHNPPLLYRNGTGYETIKARSGFVLAGMEGMTYKKQTIQLSPGDRIFLYTDGVTEASDKDNILYGEERLFNKLQDTKDDNIKDIIVKVNEDIDKYKGEVAQFDDITMLLIQFNGTVNNTDKTEIFKADGDAPTKISNFIKESIKDCPYNKASLNKIAVAVEEIAVNISNYAYGGKDGEIEVKVELRKDLSRISFTDSGVKFNPLEKKDPDITLSAEERNIGGLGIFLVKKMMDDVSYSNTDGKNVLKITKKYDKE